MVEVGVGSGRSASAAWADPASEASRTRMLTVERKIRLPVALFCQSVRAATVSARRGRTDRILRCRAYLRAVRAGDAGLEQEGHLVCSNRADGRRHRIRSISEQPCRTKPC